MLMHAWMYSKSITVEPLFGPAVLPFNMLKGCPRSEVIIFYIIKLCIQSVLLACPLLGGLSSSAGVSFIGGFTACTCTLTSNKEFANE